MLRRYLARKCGPEAEEAHQCLGGLSDVRRKYVCNDGASNGCCIGQEELLRNAKRFVVRSHSRGREVVQHDGTLRGHTVRSLLHEGSLKFLEGKHEN